jgi:hypothetical protein
MIKISLTDFVDYISNSGTNKISKVRNLKTRGNYHPSKDYYKDIRLKLVEVLNNDLPVSYLEEFLEDSHPRKSVNYQAIVWGFKKFKRTVKGTFFVPDKTIWSLDELLVSINPEIGFIDQENQIHFLKFYFKDQKLMQGEVDLVTHLLKKSYPVEDIHHGILDFKRGRILKPSSKQFPLDTLLEYEVSSLVALWEKI